MKKFQLLRLIIMMDKNLKSVVLHIIIKGGQQPRIKEYSDASALLTVTRSILSEVVMIFGS